MLEPVVGQNNVVARVSAEVDFGQVSIVEEKFDPDSVVVRSEQREKEISGGGSMPAGSPDLKYDVYQSRGGTSVGTERFEKENSTVNYEINRINKQITNSVGDVKRLSAAVIIDGPYLAEQGPDGESIQKFSPRSRREMKTFEDIIKNAIGFSQDRGDQVAVSNVPFALQEEQGALFQSSPSWLDYAKKGAKPLFNLALVALFFLFAVRPFRKWLNRAGEYAETKALPPGEEMPRLATQAGGAPAYQGSRDQLTALTKNNPDVAAEIIRNWMSEGR
jgi:flagellar M-ring protein FliF